MKFLLPALAAIAIAFTAGIFVARASAPHLATETCGQFDLKGCDLDGDGMIHLGDVTILAEHWNESVGTPYPCVPTVRYMPPEIAYNAAQTPYFVTGRAFVPTEDPRYTDNINGTSFPLRPC